MISLEYGLSVWLELESLSQSRRRKTNRLSA